MEDAFWRAWLACILEDGALEDGALEDAFWRMCFGGRVLEGVLWRTCFGGRVLEDVLLAYCALLLLLLLLARVYVELCQAKRRTYASVDSKIYIPMHQ